MGPSGPLSDPAGYLRVVEQEPDSAALRGSAAALRDSAEFTEHADLLVPTGFILALSFLLHVLPLWLGLVVVPLFFLFAYKVSSAPASAVGRKWALAMSEARVVVVQGVANGFPWL